MIRKSIRVNSKLTSHSQGLKTAGCSLRSILAHYF
jgi:hypothetical protein